MKEKILTSLAVAMLLNGCATVIDQSRLRVPEPNVIVFDSAFTYDTSKEADLPKPESGSFRGVLAGTYVAVYEDDEGIYYRAPGACIISMTVPSKGKKFLVEGGIWIEKNSPAPKFRLYRISGSSLGRPSPISEMSPCTPSSQVAAPVENRDLPVDPIVTIATTNAPAASSPGAVGAGAGLGYAVVGSIIEAEKGKLVMFPQPVGNPSIAGTFIRHPTR